MTREILEEMVSDAELPPAWASLDLESFSREEALWKHQIEALENALKALHLYYGGKPGADGWDAGSLKKRFFKRYVEDYGLEPEDLEIVLKSDKNGDLIELLGDYYEPDREETLRRYKRVYFSYEDFINRMCFWMATGSGKTWVLIKLIVIVKQLMKLGEIPERDMLMLTYRDDLIAQFKKEVQEFNVAESKFSVRLYELKDYERVKRGPRGLQGEVPVFYYPCTSISDESGKKRVDFRNYENGGKWYVFLDEAHKGDSDESKRQHIYSILSRNGFLFNFSAVFVDTPDIATTVRRYNLSDFIEAGYGKHIALLEQEIRAFRKNEDYNEDEKQKIVLKSLLMLAYLRAFRRDLVKATGMSLFHRPLLVMLGQTVNTDDADARVFFRELVRIGKGDVPRVVWEEAVEELWAELGERPSLMFEEGNYVEFEKERFHSLTQEDLRALVFNTPSAGNIEFWLQESNAREMAFKLKTGDDFFALLRIHEISKWIKWLQEELEGYEHGETVRDASFFDKLSTDQSAINILLGSRTFYEGWDSNRPNVMNFVNIGVSMEAKKFILQSIGRGVRIEPVRGYRKRVVSLATKEKLGEAERSKLREFGSLNSLPIETVFIFGTSRGALENVLKHLREESERGDAHILSLYENTEAARGTLLVPRYEEADHVLASGRDPPLFATTERELELLAEYLEAIADNEILLARHGADPERVAWLRRSVVDASKYYRRDGMAVKNLDLLVKRVLDYLDVRPQCLDSLKEVDDEIEHFRKIKVFLRSLEDIGDLERKVDTVAKYGSRSKELIERFKSKEIGAEEFQSEVTSLRQEDRFRYKDEEIRIRHVAEHYYLPLLVSDERGRVDYIRHIIDEWSEIKFVNDLDDYVRSSDGGLFKEFKWWAFSKLDESLDKVRIPYYNRDANRISPFYPDFIFWLQKDENNYAILFVDPKSTKYTKYLQKIKGFKELFEHDGESKIIRYGQLDVRVFCFLYTEDRRRIEDAGYGEHWFDNIESMLHAVVESW